MQQHILVFLLALSLSGNTLAEDLNPTVNERWSIMLGAMFQDAEIKVSAQPVGEPPEIIDLAALGAEEEDETGWVAARWRIKERWRMNFSFIDVDRDGNASAMEEFEFGDPPVEVTLGASVASSISAKFFIVQAGFALIKNDRADFGIGGGLHAADLETSVAAEITINDQSIPLGAGSADVLAPLPNIYLYGDYAFTPKLAVTGALGYFGLEVDEFDGELVSFAANLEYRPSKKWGFGVGYSLIDIDLTVNKDTRTDIYKVEAEGPRIYFVGGFGS